MRTPPSTLVCMGGCPHTHRWRGGVCILTHSRIQESGTQEYFLCLICYICIYKHAQHCAALRRLQFAALRSFAPFAVCRLPFAALRSFAPFAVCRSQRCAALRRLPFAVCSFAQLCAVCRLQRCAALRRLLFAALHSFALMCAAMRCVVRGR